MTRSLFRALAARLIVMAAAAALLGVLAVQAAADRPGPVDRSISMVCFDPGAPELGWISCASGAPIS